MIGPCDLGESGAKHDANSDMRRIATRLDNALDITAQRRDAGRHDAAVWTGTHVNTVEMDWVTRITDSSNLSQVQFLPASFEL